MERKLPNGKLKIVEKVVRKLQGHAEANREYYQCLTPEARIEMLIRMIDDYYGPQPRLERVPGSARVIRR